MSYKISVKTQLIIFLFCFLVFLSIRDNDLEFFVKAVLSGLSGLAVESVIKYFREKKFVMTEGSVITGLIVGFVLSSSSRWWTFVLAAGLAILLKYIIRIKQKHIFNPAALGIFLTVMVFKQATHWHGAYLWYIVIPFGLYFAYRIKKLSLIFIYYFLSLLSLMYFVGTGKIPLSLESIINSINHFFIFIMLIEPKTSPFGIKQTIIFSLIIVTGIFVLDLLKFSYSSELPALLAGNFILFLINLRYGISIFQTEKNK